MFSDVNFQIIFTLDVGVDLNSVWRSLTGVAGVSVVSTDWVSPGHRDFGDVKTEQYWVMTAVCWWLVFGSFTFSDFPCDSDAVAP